MLEVGERESGNGRAAVLCGQGGGASSSASRGSGVLAASFLETTQTTLDNSILSRANPPAAFRQSRPKSSAPKAQAKIISPGASSPPSRAAAYASPQALRTFNRADLSVHLANYLPSNLAHTLHFNDTDSPSCLYKQIYLTALTPAGSRSCAAQVWPCRGDYHPPRDEDAVSSACSC